MAVRGGGRDDSSNAWVRTLQRKLQARLSVSVSVPVPVTGRRTAIRGLPTGATSSWRSYIYEDEGTGAAEPKTRLRVIGYGKKGTVVYAASQILDVHRDAQVIEVTSCQGGTARIDVAAEGDAKARGAMLRLHLTAAMAVKDVRDEEDARNEAAVGNFLQACFARASCMRYCVLHPTVCNLNVDGHVLVPMRMFQSNATTLVGTCSAQVALVLCQHVMKALDVMHDNGILHLDVKPSNILIWSTPRNQRFVLGDYDIVAHVDDVVDIVRKRGLHGTAGYVSPIMSQDEESDDSIVLHPRYSKCCAALSRSSVAGLPGTVAEWIAMFGSMRRMVVDKYAPEDASRRTVLLCDMHCMAATLYELLGDGFARSGVIVNIVAGLLTGRILSSADLGQVVAAAAAASEAR